MLHQKWQPPLSAQVALPKFQRERLYKFYVLESGNGVWPLTQYQIYFKDVDYQLMEFIRSAFAFKLRLSRFRSCHKKLRAKASC